MESGVCKPSWVLFGRQPAESCSRPTGLGYGQEAKAAPGIGSLKAEMRAHAASISVLQPIHLAVSGSPGWGGAGCRTERSVASPWLCLASL